VHLHKYYLEKNQVPRELAIISLSLACLRLNETHMLEAENKSIMSILVGMGHLHLLSVFFLNSKCRITESCLLPGVGYSE